MDGITLDKRFENVVIIIDDNLQWNTPYEHLLFLQDKLDYYFSIIINGEIYEKYPLSKGKKIEIFINFKYNLPQYGLDYINYERNKLLAYAINLGYKIG